jgi:hypothetical protein
VENYGRVRQAMDDNIMQCMHFACLTAEADTHAEYVILIAFPWQQWLREHTSMLCLGCTYIACLVSL